MPRRRTKILTMVSTPAPSNWVRFAEMESIQMLPPRRVHQLHAGYVHDHGCAAPDPVKIARFQAEAADTLASTKPSA